VPEHRGLLKRALNVLSRRGVLSVGRIFVARAVHFVFERHEGYILELDLTKPIEQFEASTACECKYLETDDEIDQLAAMHPKHPGESIKAWLDAGKQCAIVKVDGKVVYVAWSDSGTVYLPNPSARVFSKEKSVTFPEGYVYRERAYTPPEERMKGFMNACFSFHMQSLSDRGFPRAITTVACKNVPSLVAVQEQGWYPTKKVRYVKVLGVKFRKVEDVTWDDVLSGIGTQTFPTPQR